MQPIRREYAPSLLRYRLARWWLTPRVRRMVTRWIPLGFVTGLGALAAMNPDNQVWATKTYEAARDAVVEHPEFAVTSVIITGARPQLVAQIEQALSLELPTSSLTLDLQAAWARIKALDPVDTAQLVVTDTGFLQVRVQERIPVAVWRNRDGMFLVDPHGVEVARVAGRGQRIDLPFVLGNGAQDYILEAVALTEAAGPIAARIRGLVRVGERRWDIVLDRDQRIMLPEVGAVDALMHVLALQLSEEVLDRDLVALDMRDRARPVLRMTDYSVLEMRRLRALDAGEDA